MESISRSKLISQWKELKKHPPKDYLVKLTKTSSDTRNFFKWELKIPGPKGSPWEGGVYKIIMSFPEEYPILPPKCVFNPPLFHPNIYPSGTICSNILNAELDWNKSIKIDEIVSGIKDLLAHPNLNSPANESAYLCMKEDEEEYKRIARKEARKFFPGERVA